MVHNHSRMGLRRDREIVVNSDRAIDARWLTGWLGTWFILSLLAESESTAGLASAIAVTVAGSVAFLLIPTIQQKMRG